MRFLNNLLLPLAFALAVSTSARADGKLYVFADTPETRVAITTLAGQDDLSIAAAWSGDTTIVGISGNGFDRGLIVKGLETNRRKPFTYSGALSISPAVAAKVDLGLNAMGDTGPVIVIAPIKIKLPDKCVFAKCLPPDWNALVLPPSDGVGSGGGIVSGGMTGGDKGGGSTNVGDALSALGGFGFTGNGRGTINGIAIPNLESASGGGDGAGI